MPLARGELPVYNGFAVPEARVTPLDLYLLHWRHHLERWWQAHASVIDGLAISALAALGAALLFD